jgi:hypothetical protein
MNTRPLSRRFLNENDMPEIVPPDGCHMQTPARRAASVPKVKHSNSRQHPDSERSDLSNYAKSFDTLSLMTEENHFVVIRLAELRWPTSLRWSGSRFRLFVAADIRDVRTPSSTHWAFE